MFEPMARSGLLGLFPTDVFLWRHLKEHLPRNVERLAPRREGSLAVICSNMLRRVRENAMRCTAVCLEVDGGRYRHLRQQRGTHDLILI
jgi:hypothetical protein